MTHLLSPWCRCIYHRTIPTHHFQLWDPLQDTILVWVTVWLARPLHCFTYPKKGIFGNVEIKILSGIPQHDIYILQLQLLSFPYLEQIMIWTAYLKTSLEFLLWCGIIKAVWSFVRKTYTWWEPKSSSNIAAHFTEMRCAFHCACACGLVHVTCAFHWNAQQHFSEMRSEMRSAFHWNVQ